MITSETINELIAALSKAQGAMEAASKDKENAGLKNEAGKFAKYADLASVWEACRKPLADNGLAVIQTAGSLVVRNRQMVEVKKYDRYAKREYMVTEEKVDASIPITTRLAHTSGQYVEEVLDMPVLRLDPHGIGSAITYGRRYSLAAMVGVYQDDDDGNAGSNKGGEPDHAPHKQPDSKKTEEKPSDPPADPPADPPENSKKRQLNRIMDGKKKLNMSEEDLKYAVHAVLGIEKLSGQSEEKYAELADFLAGLIDKKQPFEDWRAAREKESAEVDKAMQGSLPDFPA